MRWIPLICLTLVWLVLLLRVVLKAIAGVGVVGLDPTYYATRILLDVAFYGVGGAAILGWVYRRTVAEKQREMEVVERLQELKRAQSDIFHSPAEAADWLRTADLSQSELSVGVWHSGLRLHSGQCGPVAAAASARGFALVGQSDRDCYRLFHFAAVPGPAT